MDEEVWECVGKWDYSQDKERPGKRGKGNEVAEKGGGLSRQALTCITGGGEEPLG